MVDPGGIEPPLPAPQAGVLTTPVPRQEPRTRRASAPVTPQTDHQTNRRRDVRSTQKEGEL